MRSLPVPPAGGPVPQTRGGAAHLTVLHWAGFRAALTYTFDDSRASQIDHWAELRAMRLPATYYLTTGDSTYPAYDATWREARELGNELGNHTVHHCHFDLADCASGPSSTPASEIDGCTDYEKSVLGAPSVATMAYPFGDGRYARDAQSRFFLARGTRDGLIAPGDSTDAWGLPVRGAMGGETAAALESAIDDARAQGKWMILVFHTLLPAPGEAQAYAGVDITSVTASMAHVKALGDVWVDTLASVGAYWLGEKVLLAAAVAPHEGEVTWRWTLPPHFPRGRKVRVTVGGGTLSQRRSAIPWDPRGYYEVALDSGSLNWSP